MNYSRYRASTYNTITLTVKYIYSWQITVIMKVGVMFHFLTLCPQLKTISVLYLLQFGSQFRHGDDQESSGENDSLVTDLLHF